MEILNKMYIFMYKICNVLILPNTLHQKFRLQKSAIVSESNAASPPNLGRHQTNVDKKKCNLTHSSSVISTAKTYSNI